MSKDKVHKFALGDPVLEIVSGFKGIAVSRVEYMSGCIQYAVQSPVNEKGEIPDAIFFDEQRLTLQSGVSPIQVASKPTGGDFQRDRPSARR